MWIRYKLFSRQLSVMDVVDAVNDSNLILPAGDVKIGPNDYYIYSNSLVKNIKDLNYIPLKTVGAKWVSVGDVGEAKDASQLQYNIVRIDGQKSAYIPIMKQGGDTNTIQVVNDVRKLTAHLFDLPSQLKTSIVFDQSVFVKQALKTVLNEGMIGLVLTGMMILIFLGSVRATFAVLLSIPISALATFVVLYMLGSTVNTMILSGLALAFSRVIDNSVISLENIYRHLELGVASGRCRRAGRRGSKPCGVGGDIGRRGGFLPGHDAGRLEQIPLFRVGARVLPVVAGLFCSGDDGDPAFLLQVSEGSPPRAQMALQVRRDLRADALMPGSTRMFNRCWISTNAG